MMAVIHGCRSVIHYRLLPNPISLFLASTCNSLYPSLIMGIISTLALLRLLSSNIIEASNSNEKSALRCFGTIKHTCPVNRRGPNIIILSNRQIYVGRRRRRRTGGVEAARFVATHKRKLHSGSNYNSARARNPLYKPPPRTHFRDYNALNHGYGE